MTLLSFACLQPVSSRNASVLCLLAVAGLKKGRLRRYPAEVDQRESLRWTRHLCISAETRHER